MDHIETDKALEDFSQLHNNDCAIHRLEKCDCDQYGIKPFLHHRIELEVEKAVKAHAYKIKSILEKENYSNDACIYEIIKDIDSLNK